MRLRPAQLAIACALLAGGFSAGCGGDEQASDLASLVPPDVPFYGEAVLRPDDGQRAAIESLTSEIAGIDDPGAAIVAQLDRSFAGQPGGFTYAEDVEPWLGDRVAFFIRSFESIESNGMEPDGAALFETSDAGAAQDFIDRAAEADPRFPGESRTYEGVDYLTDEEDLAVGLVNDAVVIGTEEAFKVVVDAGGGESLAESDEYEDRTRALDDDQLAVMYLELSAAIQAAASSGDLSADNAKILRSLLAGPLSEPITFGFSATESAATVDVVANVGGAVPPSAASAIADLPGDAWLAAEIPDAGRLLQSWLDALAHSGAPQAASIEQAIAEQTGLDPRRDVTSWLGDLAFFLRGTEGSDFAAGAIAETSDGQGPQKLVDALRALAESQAPVPAGGPPDEADYGFTIGVPGLGPGAEVGVFGDQLVAAVSTTIEEVRDPEQTLGASEGFTSVHDQLGDEFRPVVYLDVGQGYEVALSGADDVERPGYETARPYVDKLGSFIAGIRADGDLLVSRLILTLSQ